MRFALLFIHSLHTYSSNIHCWTSISLVASKSVDGTESLPLLQALLWAINELNVISFYRYNSEKRLLIQIPVDR